MKDDLRIMAIGCLILLVMYCVGEALIETVKMFASAFGLH
jgi:hypothetical protein